MDVISVRWVYITSHKYFIKNSKVNHALNFKNPGDPEKGFNTPLQKFQKHFLTTVFFAALSFLMFPLSRLVVSFIKSIS